MPTDLNEHVTEQLFRKPAFCPVDEHMLNVALRHRLVLTDVKVCDAERAMVQADFAIMRLPSEKHHLYLSSKGCDALGMN
jgi:hypothetical protein